MQDNKDMEGSNLQDNKDMDGSNLQHKDMDGSNRSRFPMGLCVMPWQGFLPKELDDWPWLFNFSITHVCDNAEISIQIWV